jgi:hypothetical protein
VAYGFVGTAAYQGCCHCTRQQDRAHGLGDNDQGRALQGTRRTSGVKGITSGGNGVIWTVGKANST